MGINTNEIAGNMVVLIEHQSTINPNMAIRLLMYIGPRQRGRDEAGDTVVY
jgi:hypothetical protein